MDNKTFVRNFIEEVMNKGNVSAIEDYCVKGSMFAGGIVSQIQVMKTAFPDLHRTIENILSDGDEVAVQITIRGSNTGPLEGFPGFGRFKNPFPPTGNQVMATELLIFKFSDGKFQSYATEFDQIGVLQQLGWEFKPPAKNQGG